MSHRTKYMKFDLKFQFSFYLLGVFVCAGIGFRWSRFWQISFWCSLIVVGLLAAGDCSSWAGVFWCSRCGCSCVDVGALRLILDVFLVHSVLCCMWGSDSACWREMIDGGTSSPYVFLFMLLLIT